MIKAGATASQMFGLLIIGVALHYALEFALDIFKTPDYVHRIVQSLNTAYILILALCVMLTTVSDVWRIAKANVEDAFSAN